MTELISPYREGTDHEWLCGNLHAHTTESDGDLDVWDLLAAYEEGWYDVLAITDHDLLVDPDEYRDATDLTLLPGVEVTDGGPHVLAIGVGEAIPPHEDRQRVLDHAADDGAIRVMAHPNWGREFSHVSPADLYRLSGYTAIEVYNGASRRGRGSPLATDRWDRLLSAGRTVWGTATDDAHRPEDVGNAWTVVLAADRSPEAILDALRAGRFYASTGVEVTEIRVDDREIRVATEDARTIRLVSDHGAVQRTVDAREAVFRVPDDLRYHEDHTYVRVECLGDGDAAAWVQPAWIVGE